MGITKKACQLVLSLVLTVNVESVPLRFCSFSIAVVIYCNLFCISLALANLFANTTIKFKYCTFSATTLQQGWIYRDLVGRGGGVLRCSVVSVMGTWGHSGRYIR